MQVLKAALLNPRMDDGTKYIHPAAGGRPQGPGDPLHTRRLLIVQVLQQLIHLSKDYVRKKLSISRVD